MKVLIIAEHDNVHLKSSTQTTVGAAKQLSDDLELLILGYQCETVINEAKQLSSVKHILVADSKHYEHQLPENTALLIAEIAKPFKYILAPATTFGKNLLPRVAALLDVDMISDVVKIISENTFVRPIYAGNAFSMIETHDPIKLLTIRPTAFDSEAPTKNNAEVEVIQKDIPNSLSEFEKHELTKSSRPELSNARIIISGGRGLKSADNFKLLEQLADKLGAGLGASRAAVDAGFAPNDYQVGQTGKVVAPDLYIAIGISGAIQHLAGMKDSKVIVAINQDPDAPIFQIADYGYVGDLFAAINELMEEL